MELIYSVNLIFLFAANILFFFSGICLNSLVIVSFWRSVQLRKKLCYFTIMVLSCCDLLAVLTNHPFTGLVAMLWLTGQINVYPGWLVFLHVLSDMSMGCSLVALFVMSFDRYLATHYPIFHRTSVTKGKLLTLFTFSVIVGMTLMATSINGPVISYQVRHFIFSVFFIPPMLFINYKLFTVARKSRRNKEIPPRMKKSFTLKNISSCLLAVACLAVLSIPAIVYIGLRVTSKKKEFILDDAHLAGLWVHTTYSMNSTFNCLIFYWKNRTLRKEGTKVIKSMEICRRGESRSVHAWQAENNNGYEEKKMFNFEEWRKQIKIDFYNIWQQQTIIMYN